MLNITKGQILYVISQNGTKIKPAKVIDIIKNCDESIDPDWYMDVVTKYLDSKTNGTVTFRPKDFGVIIFDSEQKAKSEMNKKQNEPIKKAKLTAENVKIICHKCLSSEKKSEYQTHRMYLRYLCFFIGSTRRIQNRHHRHDNAIA